MNSCQTILPTALWNTNWTYICCPLLYQTSKEYTCPALYCTCAAHCCIKACPLLYRASKGYACPVLYCIKNSHPVDIHVLASTLSNIKEMDIQMWPTVVSKPSSCCTIHQRKCASSQFDVAYMLRYYLIGGDLEDQLLHVTQHQVNRG